jgi:putative hydrolase of the HAD superfamily
MTQPLWIVFDAVGTLIEPVPSVAEAYWRIGNKFGSQYTIEDILSRFRKQFEKSYSNSEGEKHCSNEEIELARWKQIVERVLDDVTEMDACFAEVHSHFSKPEAWQVFTDVPPLLQSLKQAGYSLAIGSNFDHRIHEVCAGHSELMPIDVAFASAELGYRKPSLIFYSELASRLNVSPTQMLMIGDHEENDVISARQAGLSALLIDRFLS